MHKTYGSTLARGWERVLLLLVMSILTLPISAFAISATALVPLNSWVYPALEKLVGVGLIETSLQGTRPYNRSEAARQIKEARQQAELSPVPVVMTELLQRLKQEFREELEESPLSGEVTGSYFKPLRHLAIRYLYRDGEDAILEENGIRARQFSLNINNDGIDYSENSNIQLLMTSEARYGRSLLFEVNPILLFREGKGSDLQLLRGRTAQEVGPLELSAGRQSLWWGQGRHGSLILSNNAKPLDMLRITTPAPVILPWIFQSLGPFRIDLFLSKLGKNRLIPDPYLSGLRINFKPFPWVEFGGSRTLIFGGKGQPQLSFSDFSTILSGRNLSGGEDTSNSLAALDILIRVPFLRGAEIYGEFGGEDEAGHFIANTAMLYGLYLPVIDPTGRGSLRIEYADFQGYNHKTTPWYRHSLYRSGYTYEGTIFGHHAGGTGRDFYSAMSVLLLHDLTLELALDVEERNNHLAISEKHVQPTVQFDWQYSSNRSVTAKYALDQVNNFAFTPGDNRTFQMIELGFNSSW